MENSNSIVVTKEYGSVIVCLRNIMDKKGISRNTLARNVNVRFEVIDRWYNGTLEKLDLDILARVCFALDCDISEILKYKK